MKSADLIAGAVSSGFAAAPVMLPERVHEDVGRELLAARQGDDAECDLLVVGVEHGDCVEAHRDTSGACTGTPAHASVAREKRVIR